MKRIGFFISILGIILSVALNSHAQEKVIFDTDFGGDADDLGALTMLNYFIDTKECDLLAVMAWTQEKYAVPAIDAVNTFYHHPDIPIGVRKGGSFQEPYNYTKPIADSFPSDINQEQAADAVVLYRQILAKAADNSIIIIAVGPLANFKNLMNSQADSISSLNGKELIDQKVKEFVIMGGQYPSGKWEWNFSGNMPGVTKFVLGNITKPITFSGYEIGQLIKTGEVFNEIDRHTPLYVGFMHFSQNAPWIKAGFKGRILDNCTYDQTAVYYAIRGGLGSVWEKVNGICLPDDEGGNQWQNTKDSNQAYLKLLIDPEIMAANIEALMLHKEPKE